MTQDPKKRPAWLSGSDKKPNDKPPPSEPEDSAANTGDADVPPWLRDDAPPPPPRVKRVAPPPPEQQGEGDLPPWLADADQPAQPKSYKIGGTELSEEYLSGGDSLPDTLDSEMTFDSWMANQVESNREKDIEEEVPDDLFSTIGKDTGPLKQTGQLPDWFLGLESLDTTEAPEWFVDEEAEPQPETPATPSWISNMMGEEEPADELPSADEIGSFFTSIGGMGSQDEEETPDIDWYDQIESPNDALETPGEDFFTQLVSGGSPSNTYTGNDQYTRQVDADAFADFEDFNDAEEVETQSPAQGSVEIPQNELDAFFSNVASDRGQPPVSLDDIEDPEMEWIVEPEPEPEVVEIEPEPEMPLEAAEESADWLNELQSIVKGATGPLKAPQDAAAYTGTEDTKEAWEAPAETAASVGEFKWPEPQVEAPEPEPEPAESDWLSTITPSDAEYDVSPAEPLLEHSRMTERLYREPEPEPTPAEEESSDWESLVNATLPANDALYSAEPEQVDDLFASEFLTSTDDFFSSAPAQAETTAETDAGFVSEAEQADELFMADDLYSVQPERVDLFANEPNYGSGDQPIDLFADEPLYASETTPADDDLIPEAELQSGWMSDDLLADESDASESDEDFFSLLEADADVNLLDESEQQAQWNAEQALSEADLMGALSLDQPAEAAQEDDLYPSFNFDAEESAQLAGVTADDEEEDALGQWQQQATTEEVEQEDLYGQWQNEQQPAEQETAQEDDFYAALGVENDTQPAVSAQEDVYGQWQTEQPVEQATQEDDFFASLGTETEDDALSAALPNTGELIGQWQDEQPAEQGAQEDDFFASLGVEDEAQAAALPNTGDLIGQWQDEDDQPAEQAAQEDDFYATLGVEDSAQPTAVSDTEEDAYGQWQDEQPVEQAAEEADFFSVLDIGKGDETEAAPAEEAVYEQWQTEQPAEPAAQEDDFFASLGMDDEAQRAALPNTGDLIGQWQDEDELPAEAAQEDEFFASLGLETEDQAQASALPNTGDLIGQWQDEDEQPAEQAAQEDDFFASLGISDENDETFVGALPNTGDLISQWQEEHEEELQASALPNTGDLIDQWQTEQPVEEEAQADDFFASLGMETEDAEEQPAAVESDPFADWDTQAEVPPTQDFFEALDLIDENQQEGQAIPDFFASLNEPSGPAEQTPAFGDVDSYLASLSSTPTEAVPQMPFDQDAELDLDALFSDAMLSKPDDAAPADMLPGANEDWLLQMQASVGDVSASAIVRQQEDRPVEELSDRLKKLRQSAEEIPDEAPITESGALTPSSPFVGGSMGMAQSIALTPEQEKQVKLLRALVPSNERSEPERISAIDATYNSPFMPDLEDTPETTIQPVKAAKVAKPRRRARKRRRGLGIRLDRFLVAVVLAAAVILPFVLPGFRVGNLPPSNFAAGSGAQSAFDHLDALQAGDLVLVGVEYGAASAAELDGVTDALLRHIIMRAAFPVIVSGNPVGLLRSETRIAAINQDTDFLQSISATEPLVENIDYYVVRYLPGSVIGLRAFSADTANMLLSDIHGQTTNLSVGSMQDFALVTVITDRAEDLRAYAEQIAPLTRAPLVSAVSYSAAPLAEPYARTLGGGLLVGYADGYTYTNLLDTVTANSIAGRIRILPTEVPPPVVETVAPELAGTLEPTTLATARPTRVPATPTIPPTQALDTATVTGDAVNVRIGPGTNNPILASVSSGTVLTVLGFNADSSWVNVRLDDGREGWVSAALVSIQQAQSSAPKSEINAKRRQAVDEGDTPTPRPPTATQSSATETSESAATTESDPTETDQPPSNTPRPTRTAIPSATATEVPTATPTEAATEEATPEATAEVTEEAAVPFTISLPPPSPGYRDERWYAMNGGIVASALIITLGMVVNLVRGLVRRGQRG